MSLFPYQDKNLSAAVRAEDLLGRMTIQQKIAQLQCIMTIGAPLKAESCPDGLGVTNITSFDFSRERQAESMAENVQAVAKNAWGIPPILHTEALTGLTVQGATVFPSAIGLGASFDPQMVEDAAAVIHNETRAMGYHQTLSPVLDVCRDPRWGRVGETYGEDPTLCAMIGTAYVKGLQGKEGDMVSATGKHFLGYGLSSGGLNMATCVAADREIREVYAKPFQAAMTEGKMLSVMNSYGTIDGEMVIGSEKILTDLLRDEMEFEGIVVSDYTSIEHLVDHRIASDMDEAGHLALRAGLDMECPFPKGYSTGNLMSGLENGKVSMEWIDRSVKRILEVKIRLGMLDGVTAALDRFDIFDAPESRELSLRAAREATVLLKNDGILPLPKKNQKIAVIGPHADSIRLLFGGYTLAASIDMMIAGSLSDQAGMDATMDDLAEASMKVKDDLPKYPGSNVDQDNEEALAAVAAAYPSTKSIIQSLKEKAPETEFVYLKGCDIAGNDRSQFAEAQALAKESDAVIVTVGGKYGWGGSCTVGEGIDSDTIGLTGIQEELVLTLTETGTPVIVVHMDARPLCSPAIAEKANAILEYWFPGQTGGEALADILFGDYNPAGRLPITALRSVGQVPVYNGQYCGNSYYSTHAGSSSCRYVDSMMEPLYYFGHGLSYTTFEYRDIMTSQPEVASDGEITISCKVKNTGDRAGEEVVQLYISDLKASVLRPYQEFAGSARVFLEAGEEKAVCFTVRADQFAFVGKDGKWIVEEGDMEAMIGTSSADLPLHTNFSIADTAYVRPARRGFYAAVTVR